MKRLLKNPIGKNILGENVVPKQKNETQKTNEKAARQWPEASSE